MIYAKTGYRESEQDKSYDSRMELVTIFGTSAMYNPNTDDLIEEFSYFLVQPLSSNTNRVSDNGVAVNIPVEAANELLMAAEQARRVLDLTDEGLDDIASAYDEQKGVFIKPASTFFVTPKKKMFPKVASIRPC